MREVVWTFWTARFRVELQIEPEDMDPADSFQFEDDIEAVRSGAVEWFQAVVVVYCDDRKVAWDALGGCAYETVREFYQAHRGSDVMNRNCSVMRAACGNVTIMHYFPGSCRRAA